MEHLPHILLIGGSDEVLAKLPGLPVRATYAQRASALTPRSRACVCRVVAVNYSDARAMSAIAGRLDAEDPLDAVICVDEYALNVAAEISEQLGIAGCKSDAVRMSRDKYAMRKQ